MNIFPTARKRTAALLLAVALPTAGITAAPAFADPPPKPSRCHTVKNGYIFCCPKGMEIIRVKGEEMTYGCRAMPDKPPQKP